MKETWYLLFGGTSEDGRGPGKYVGRTTDADQAKQHLDACRSDPFSTGKVIKADDSEFTTLLFWRKHDD